MSPGPRGTGREGSPRAGTGPGIARGTARGLFGLRLGPGSTETVRRTAPRTSEAFSCMSSSFARQEVEGS